MNKKPFRIDMPFHEAIRRLVAVRRSTVITINPYHREHRTPTKTFPAIKAKPGEHS
jgi:hypothetical protein